MVNFGGAEGSSRARVLRALLDSDEAEMSVVITDPHQDDNPVIFVSAEFVEQTGYTEDETLGRNIRFMQGPATDPRARQMIRLGLRQRITFSVDILNYRRDGEPFLNRLRIRPLFDEAGRLTHFVGAQNPT